MNKVFYDPEEQRLMLCLGKSTIPNFKRFIAAEKPLCVISIHKDLIKSFICIGDL